MKIRESCLQNGSFIYKAGISFTKQDFKLQNGSFGIQTGFSACYLPDKYHVMEMVNYFVDGINGMIYTGKVKVDV